MSLTASKPVLPSPNRAYVRINGEYVDITPDVQELQDHDEAYFARQIQRGHQSDAMRIVAALPETKEAALNILRIAADLVEWRETSVPTSSGAPS